MADPRGPGQVLQLVNAFVAVTDRDWFEYLQRAGGLDEVNFWQPSPGGFRALKLHSPDNFIVGGGIFSHWTRLRVSLAWEAFDIKSGAESLPEMRTRIEHYRRIRPAPHEDYEIGCILLQEPFFFSRDEWLPVPDWHANIVRGKAYDLTVEPGRPGLAGAKEGAGTTPLVPASLVGESRLRRPQDDQSDGQLRTT